MNFPNNSSEEEMSMEDILSSIRKYVSEEDEKNNSSSNDQLKESIPSDGDAVIKLRESNIVSPIDSTSTQQNSEIHIKSPLTYEEKSTLAESVVAPVEKAPKKSPFGQLADALSSYGRNKASAKAEEQKRSSPTIDEFLTKISERLVEEWINKNLNNIVTKIVIQEIEKMKSDE